MADQGTTGADATQAGPASSSGDAERPAVSLRPRMIIWSAALVMVPLLCTAFVVNRITHRAMLAGQARTAQLLTNSLAYGLGDRIEGGWNASAEDVVDALSGDPRVSMIVVTDADGAVLHRRLRDSDAIAMLIGEGKDEEAFALDVGRPHYAGADGQLVVLRQPIWSPPLTAGAPRRLVGYVLAGVHERDMPALLRELAEVEVLAAALACLVMLPIVLLVVHRWVKPIRAMLLASYDLAAGRTVEPVPCHHRDELGRLGEAFNHMAERLIESREQLTMHNERLEELVRQRTTELEEANRRLADEAEDRTEFLRAISHDLGAPLRNINGMASMVLTKHAGDLPEDVVAKLERIVANVKRQTALIGDLAELNKARKSPTASDGVDVREVIDEILATMAHQIEAGSITVTFRGEFPTIQAERNRITQIFQNLIDNAAKYMMDAPTRRITIVGEADIDYYRFAVEDTGRGIAWEDMPKVFQVFQRGTRSGTHAVEGRGVGLASVKSMVEGYGGQIWVDSELGEGATFNFTLARERVSMPTET